MNLNIEKIIILAFIGIMGIYALYLGKIEIATAALGIGGTYLVPKRGY